VSAHRVVRSPAPIAFLPSPLNRGCPRNRRCGMQQERRHPDHRAGFRHEVSNGTHGPAHAPSIIGRSPDGDRFHESGMSLDDRERGVVDSGRSEVRPGRGIRERRGGRKSHRDRTGCRARREREPGVGVSRRSSVSFRAGKLLFASLARGRPFQGFGFRCLGMQVERIERGPVGAGREHGRDRQRQRRVLR
jgi:hypothetical protein